MKKNAVIYLPPDEDATDLWQVVTAALRSAGITYPRSAPMPAQPFKPKHVLPVLLSSEEV
ncbi:hypothetical protein SAE02_69600 [Skermanella aerolata]|uniref:Uncharacterized protein n=1 Tax=Skermanella aerolata TaxID=393310 RepID=A0A512E271_9PROT|nr:hypothetical protein N826_31380 [Skermanella aerolata KACC 11604]GEO42812.1 hypothetical protein SAE02_69600 [Skermanella aerolata]